jgi:myo-inositol-1-phosphate synthase
LVGATGRVGSAVALGIAALRDRRAPATGLVSSLPPFQHVPLVAAGNIILGGHEIRRETLLGAVLEAHEKARIFDEDLILRCASDLRKMQKNILPGTLLGADAAIVRMAESDRTRTDASAATAIERLSSDIRSFRRKNKLDQVVVIHTASCEPPFSLGASHRSWKKLSKAMTRRGARALPPSSLYALAAIEADAAYVNFTPSLGVSVPAIEERAKQRGLPYMGCDGKTGETLVKSALAPMFAMRNLSILSWVGQNILGNRDGEVLSNPATRAAKLKSKDKTVARIVGGSPTTRVSIEYVPSLDDWKVAWDYIHFEGFLGTKMSMQFTWAGCDSILAAPLVIDLARFAALERRCGAAGPMKHLAFFFKDPMHVDEHDLASQWRSLVSHFRAEPT